jgi:Family of unknown function (DUF6498)/Protein of unknown function (DUF3592)
VATLADVHRYPTAIPVIVANCIPIVGVLALGWDLRSIMFVYWFETAVVVFYSALKVVTVGGPITLLGMPAHLTFFGVFMSFHLMMILALEPLPPGSGFFPPEIVRELFRRTWSADVGLVVSHGISFVVNFLGKGEYRRTTVKQEIAAPWKRLLIMHATTFAGAWSVMLFEAPVGALVMLAVLKIVVDLHGHLRARRDSPDAEPARPVPVSGTKLEGVLGLFGAFFVFCGLLLAAGSGGQVYRASRVRTQWSAVDAEVLDCRVNESVDRGRNVSHVVRCRFRYDVDGVEHVTTYWTHSTRDGETAAEMRRWVAQHRSGAVQPIRFDPRAPDRISLGELGETIDPPLVGQTLTAAGGFAGVGALLLVIARWRARRAAGHRPDA